MNKCNYAGCINNATATGYCTSCYHQNIIPAIERLKHKPKDYIPEGRDSKFTYSFGEREVFYDMVDEMNRVNKQFI